MWPRIEVVSLKSPLRTTPACDSRIIGISSLPQEHRRHHPSHHQLCVVATPRGGAVEARARAPTKAPTCWMAKGGVPLPRGRSSNVKLRPDKKCADGACNPRSNMSQQHTRKQKRRHDHTPFPPHFSLLLPPSPPTLSVLPSYLLPLDTSLLHSHSPSSLVPFNEHQRVTKECHLPSACILGATWGV